MFRGKQLRVAALIALAVELMAGCSSGSDEPDVAGRSATLQPIGLINPR